MWWGWAPCLQAWCPSFWGGWREPTLGDQMWRELSTVNPYLLRFPFASLACSVFPVCDAVLVTVWPITFWFAAKSRAWGSSSPHLSFILCSGRRSISCFYWLGFLQFSLLSMIVLFFSLPYFSSHLSFTINVPLLPALILAAQRSGFCFNARCFCLDCACVGCCAYT